MAGDFYDKKIDLDRKDHVLAIYALCLFDRLSARIVLQLSFAKYIPRLYSDRDRHAYAQNTT